MKLLTLKDDFFLKGLFYVGDLSSDFLNAEASWTLVLGSLINLYLSLPSLRSKISGVSLGRSLFSKFYLDSARSVLFSDF